MDNAVKKAIEEKKAYAAELRIIRPTGTEAIVSAYADIEFNEVGNPVRMFGAIQDITNQYRDREALKRSEERFRTIFDSNMLAIAFWRKNGALIDVNQAFYNLGSSILRAVVANLTGKRHSALLGTFSSGDFIVTTCLISVI